MRIDVHCHVGQRSRRCDDAPRFSFEPPGQYAPFDAYFSDRLNHGIGMRIARRFFGLTETCRAGEAGRAGEVRRRRTQPADSDRGAGSSRLQRAQPADSGASETDAAIERLLLAHILGAKRIDRVVALAFDQYHTTAGEPIGPRSRGWRFGTDLYVSNTYVRQLWLTHPRRILFGASLHPYRQQGSMTAADMLEEVAAAGAVLVKWLPLNQNIDIEDPRTVTFLRRAGQLGIPILIHYGTERALPTLHSRFKDPAPLLRTLRRLRAEGDMPTVIVAHAATPAMWPVASARTFRTLIDALTGEFSDAPLYADTAALTLFNKARWLRRLLRTPAVLPKLVHGSDFPIPPTTLAFRRELGNRYRPILAIDSWIDRDAAIKTALGVPDHVFTRAGQLLAERIARADAIAQHA